MKLLNKNLIIALFAIMLCIIITSCKKDESSTTPQSTTETTLIGNWISYKWQEIDEEGTYSENTHDYSVVFTETTASLSLEFDEHTTIISDYKFKEGDESIIYFQRAYDDYGYMIVAQFLKNEGKLIVEVHNDYWDWYNRYYFNKQ
ncbi:MAG: hypothetical protein II401_00120 [Bacteroidales bacterium]|nr:hypothetical protein [Bacteroidales bacterium]